jgi:hypothetical protein
MIFGVAGDGLSIAARSTKLLGVFPEQEEFQSFSHGFCSVAIAV